MKTAIIYARVSSRRQADEGISMEAQIDLCTQRAQQLGARVVRVFRDDGITGTSTKARVGFQGALHYCGSTDIDYFITWSTSRFARNAIDLWVHSDQLKAAGTRVECLNADIDDETDAGFINRVFMGAMDQLVSRNIGRDTLKSMKRSAAAGYFTGGRVPFGYLSVADGPRNRLQPHPDEALVIQRAFQACLEGLGAQAIATRLNEAGLLRRGQRWRKTTVAYILSNDVYTGMRTFNRTDKRSGREKPREEWVQVDSHPALVEKQDFERAQAMMDQRAPHHEKGGTPRSQFVFAGLLKCGVCESPLQVINGTSHNGSLYSYYGCLAHRRGEPRCLLRNVRADLFDNWLLDQILHKILTPEVIDQAMKEIVGQTARWAQEREAHRALMVKELRALESKRDRLYELLETHGRDTPDLPDVTRRLKDRNAEIRVIEQNLSRLEEPRKAPRMPKVDVETAVEVMREAVTEGGGQKKRAFMGAFIQAISVTADRVTIEYQAQNLVTIGHPSSVRSDSYWLPDNQPLRTATLEILRPFMLAKHPFQARYA